MVSLTASLRRGLGLAMVLGIMLVLSHTAQAEPLSTLTERLGGQSAESGEEAEQPEPIFDQQSLDRAIELLEDEQARQALLTDLRALQQGLEVEQEMRPDESRGVLTALSDRMSWLGDTLTLEPTLNRWALLLESTRQDFQWLFGEPEGRRMLLREIRNFIVLGLIILLAAGVSWWLLWYPAQRLDRRRKLALGYSVRCLPALFGFATALLVLPLVGSHPGSRIAVVGSYIVLGGVGLFLVATLLISLVEQGPRRRLVAILLRRIRPWLIAIGASLAAADAFSNQWVSESLGGTLPALLTSWFYLLTALLSGLLAFRHHRLATMTLRPRGRRDAARTPLWLAAGEVAARSWQWAVIAVSAMSFLGILLLQGEEQVILQAGVLSALVLVATTLCASVVATLIEQGRTRLLSPPNRSWYLAAYARLGRVLAQLIIWVLGLELVLLAWGSSMAYFFQNVIGEELAEVLISLLVITIIGWAAWVGLKTAIERALAQESQNMQSQSARSRTLLPLLRSLGLALILIMGVITALAAIGVNTTPLLAGAGVLGLAIGFGSQKLVQDLITGLFILFEDTIALGDYIQVAGHEGIVEGLSVRTVRMRDLNGTLHAVPFGEITSVRNLSKDYAYAMIELTVPYREDVDQIIAELEAIGGELRKDPILGWEILEPLEVFGLQKFTPDGMVIRVRFMTRPLRQWDVMRGYNLRIKRRFDELGIQMPVQQVMVHQAEGPNRPTRRVEPASETFTPSRGLSDVDEP